MAAGSGKKIAILALVGILVVGAVVATVVTVTRKNSKNDSKPGNDNAIKSNKKSIDTVCDATDHKDICVKTLDSAAGDVTNPQELVKIAFNITKNVIDESQKNFSKLVNDVANDPRTSQALEQCNELVALAMEDLTRSIEKLGSLDITQIDEILETIKIWLSAALTYEDTCLDGFQDTTGDASQRMKDILKEAMELTENTLGMVTEVANTLSGHSSSNRRLLSVDQEGYPSWMGASTRKLLDAHHNNIKADIVVAKDGSGQFKSIIAALDSIKGRTESSPPLVVRVKEGVYDEKVVIKKEYYKIVLVGDGPRKTKVTGKLAVPGTSTFHSASFIVMADNFVARDFGFENTAGIEAHQAVAIRVSADFAAFQNCRFDAYQDTLYAQNYRHFYRDCTITGTIDFIFGDAAAVFQNCNILVRKCKPNQFNAVTAHGRLNKKMPTGFVLQNCKITENPESPPLKTTKSYLGRPWKNFARTIIMESEIGDVIAPEGWMEWSGQQFHQQCWYSEYNNRGPKADKSHRVKWKSIYEMKKEVAEMFTASKFIAAEKWIPGTKVPFNGGFLHPTPADAPNAVGLAQSGVWKKDLTKEDYVDKNKSKKKKHL